MKKDISRIFSQETLDSTAMSEIKGGLPNSGSNVIDCKNVECINNKCTKGDGCDTNISCTDLGCMKASGCFAVVPGELKPWIGQGSINEI